jgi:hypothetical protein
MAASTRAFGTETSEMAKVLRGIPMVILTLDNSNTAKHMVKESIPGKMERYSMASGTRD